MLNRKKKEKDTIKANQKNFITLLRDAGMKNITGDFKVVNSSSSSRSNSSTSSPKFATSPGKSRDSIPRPSEERHNVRRPQPLKEPSQKRAKSKERADEEEVDEEIEENVSIISRKSDNKSIFPIQFCYLLVIGAKGEKTPSVTDKPGSSQSIQSKSKTDRRTSSMTSTPKGKDDKTAIEQSPGIFEL